MIELLLMLAIASQMDKDVISQTSCIALEGRSLNQAKNELLITARRGAVEQLFGSLVTSLTQVENLVLRRDDIRAVSLGYIHIVGNPVFFNGQNLGELCVKIQAYSTEEDRAKLMPNQISKRICLAEGDISSIRKRAEEKAILEALTDYDGALKQLPATTAMALLHAVRFSDDGFVSGTTTYCVRATGTLYPVEAATARMHQRREELSSPRSDRSGPPVDDLTGTWELTLVSTRNIQSSGVISESQGSITQLVDLKQEAGQITGSIIGATHNGCTNARISGGWVGKEIHWSVHFSGHCCLDAEEIFVGEVDHRPEGQLIRGRLIPKGRPPHDDCFLWWADVEGLKKGRGLKYRHGTK